jgi:hypothetical protein
MLLTFPFTHTQTNHFELIPPTPIMAAVSNPWLVFLATVLTCPILLVSSSTFPQWASARYGLRFETMGGWPTVARELLDTRVSQSVLGANGVAWFLTSKADLVCCSSVHDLSGQCTTVESGFSSGSFLASMSPDGSGHVAVFAESGEISLFGEDRVEPCSTGRAVTSTDAFGTLFDVYSGREFTLVASETGLHVLAAEGNSKDSLGLQPLWSWSNLCDGANQTVAPVYSVTCADDGSNCGAGTEQCFLWFDVAEKRRIRHEWTGGLLDGRPIAAVFAEGSYWVATSRSLNEYRLLPIAGAAAGVWQRYAGGPGGLPAANITDLVAGPGSTLVLATASGVVIFVDGRFDFLAGPRWLATDNATDSVAFLSTIENGTVVVGSSKFPGISVLSLKEWTLRAKAIHFQQTVAPRHFRLHTGLISSLPLAEFGNLESADTNAPDDNDGLWAEDYLAAQSFRYAVGDDPAAKKDAAAQALQMLTTLENLVNVTGVAGLPARTMVAHAAHKNEPDHWGWNPSLTKEGWWFIGNTSSDEMTGHMFGLSVFMDVGPVHLESAGARAQKLMNDMVTRIVKGGLVLRDIEWTHETKWGHWDPLDLNGNFSWSDERGLNSLQILAYLATALAHQPSPEKIAEEPYKSYLAVLGRLVDVEGYLLNILNQKITSPGEINFSDNDLAFKPYYTLGAACQFGSFANGKRSFSSPEFAALCRKIAPAFQASIERAWRVIAPGKQSMFGFIYAAVVELSLVAKADDAVQASIETLQEYPVDIIEWPTDNRKRVDLDADQAMLPSILRSRTAIPRHQSAALRWCDDPFAFVGGTGMREEDPTFFLGAFWLAAFHQFV